MQYNRQLLTYSIYFAVSILGFSTVMTGASVPAIAADLNLKVSDISKMVSWAYAGFMFAALFCGFTSDLLSKKGILLFGLICQGCGLSLLGKYNFLLINSVLMGIIGVGGGILQTISISTIIDMYEQYLGNTLNRFAAFFHIGSIVSPLCVGKLLSLGYNWRYIYVLTAFAIFALFFFFYVQRFPEAKNNSKSINLKSLAYLFKHGIFVILCILPFVSIGIEACIKTWSAAYLKKFLSASVALSSISLSIFCMGLALGGIICSLVAHKVNHYFLVFLLSLGTFISILCALMIKISLFALILFGISGVFLGGIFPTATAIAGARFTKLSGTVSGVFVAAGCLGSVLFLWFMSFISESIFLL